MRRRYPSDVMSQVAKFLSLISWIYRLILKRLSFCNTTPLFINIDGKYLLQSNSVSKPSATLEFLRIKGRHGANISEMAESLKVKYEYMRKIIRGHENKNLIYKSEFTHNYELTDLGKKICKSKVPRKIKL